MGVFVILQCEAFWVSLVVFLFFFLRQFISAIACFCNLRKSSCLRIKAGLVVTNLFHPILQQQGETDGFREDQGTLICAVQAQGLKK